MKWTSQMSLGFLMFLRLGGTPLFHFHDCGRADKFAKHSMALHVSLMLHHDFTKTLERFFWESWIWKTMLDSRFCLGPFQVFTKSNTHMPYEKVQGCLLMSPETSILRYDTYTGRKLTYQTSWCIWMYMMYSISRFRVPNPWLSPMVKWWIGLLVWNPGSLTLKGIITWQYP